MKSGEGNNEKRLTSLEKAMFVLKVGGIVLAVIGISAGGLLWKGYDVLKEKEQTVFSDYSRLQDMYQEALKEINALKAENAKVFSSSLDKFDKMSESYLELRQKVTLASEEASKAMHKAGDLSKAVELACKSAETADAAAKDNARILEEVKTKALRVEALSKAACESQRALEVFLSDKFSKRNNKPFEIVFSGFNSTCTFMEGASVPFSRNIHGDHLSSVVIVPPDETCVVKLRGDHCRVRIQAKLQGRVIVDGGGFNSHVEYFR